MGKCHPCCLLEYLFKGRHLEDERDESNDHGTTKSGHCITDRVRNALGPFKYKVANLEGGEMDL